MVNMLNFRSCMFYNKLKYNFQTNEQKHLSHCWRFSERRTFKIEETSKLELSSLKGPGGPQTHNSMGWGGVRVQRQGTWGRLQWSQGCSNFRPRVTWSVPSSAVAAVSSVWKNWAMSTQRARAFCALHCPGRNPVPGIRKTLTTELNQVHLP